MLKNQKSGGAPRRGTGTAGQESQDVSQVSKIIADERSNAIIVLASKRAIDKVRSLINRLDAQLEEGAEGRIHVHYLRYAKAKEVAEVLQSLSSVAKSSTGAKQEGVIVADLEDFKVAPDEQTNALLITSNVKTYRSLVDEVISKLDIPRKQVYLEAVIMEFFLSRGTDYGVKGHGGAALGGVLPFAQDFGSLARLFSPTGTGGGSGGFFNQPGLLGGLLSRRTVDIQMPDSSGAIKTFSIPAFSAFITALKSFGETNIVSTPNILTLDNEEAAIEITAQEPRPGTQTVTSTNAVQIAPVEYEEAGLKLKITPQISGEAEGTSVRLAIENELSTFRKASFAQLNAPAKVKRVVKTTVVTDDGQTVVLGGLMEDKEDIKKDKIPLLGDIPVLGFLFRQTSTSKSKSNLLIFITPHVIRDSGDFMTVLERKVGQRNQFLEENYDKKRRSTIRTVIKGHREDLLDLLQKPPAQSAQAPGLKPATAAPASPAGVASPAATTPKPAPVLPEKGYVRPPVITIPPPGGKPAESDLSY